MKCPTCNATFGAEHAYTIFKGSKMLQVCLQCFMLTAIHQQLIKLEEILDGRPRQLRLQKYNRDDNRRADRANPPDSPQQTNTSEKTSKKGDDKKSKSQEG